MEILCNYSASCNKGGKQGQVRHVTLKYDGACGITLLSRFLGHLNMYTSPRKYDLLSAQFTKLPRDSSVLYGQSVLEDKSKIYFSVFMHYIQLK